jgi:hypothetical protein
MMGGGGLFADKVGDKVAASGGSAGGTTGNTTGAGDSALHKRRGASEMSASEAGGDEAGGANQRCGGLGNTQAAAAAACVSPASLAGSSRLRRLILTPLAPFSNTHKRACGASFGCS